MFSEIAQELLHASRFILGTSERAAFCIMLVGELNKNGMQVAGGHQTSWELISRILGGGGLWTFLDCRVGGFKTTSPTTGQRDLQLTSGSRP